MIRYVLSLFILLLSFSSLALTYVGYNVVDGIYHRSSGITNDGICSVVDSNLGCICIEAYVRGVRKVKIEEYGDTTEQAFEITCPAEPPQSFPPKLANDQAKIKDFLKFHQGEAKDICTKNIFDFDVVRNKFGELDDVENEFDEPDIFWLLDSEQREIDCSTANHIHLTQQELHYTDYMITLRPPEDKFKMISLPGDIFAEKCLTTTVKIPDEESVTYYLMGEGRYYFYNNQQYEKFERENKHLYSYDVRREEFDKFCKSHGFDTQ